MPTPTLSLICLHLEELQRQMYTSIEDGIVFRSCDNIMRIIGTPQVIKVFTCMGQLETHRGTLNTAIGRCLYRCMQPLSLQHLKLSVAGYSIKR